MKLLDRYVGRVVILASLGALALLVALSAFFAFLAELGDLSGDYGVVEAAAYVAFTVPRVAYEMFPTGVLLGGLFGLGNLAASRELLVIRTSGVSVLRVTASVLRAGLVLVLLAVVLGEFIAPPSEQHAHNLRSSARLGYITLQSPYGFWARDGSGFVNIRRVLSRERLEEIYIYDYERPYRLRSATHAKAAEYRDGSWVLHDIDRTFFENGRVHVRSQESAQWESLLNPDLLTVLTVDPQRLSAWALTEYIDYLSATNVNTQRYRLAFWVKVVTPLSGLVMLLLAIPFVFGPLRTVGTGQRLLLGVLVGLAFGLLNRAFNHVGVVYGLSPFLSAALPSLLFAAAALIAMRRVR